jgi:hypothetical protein
VAAAVRRRRLLLAVAAVAVVAVAAGIAVGTGGRDGPSERVLGAGLTTRAPSSTAALPLEQAVGQTLVMAFPGTTAPEYVRRRMRNGE